MIDINTMRDAYEHWTAVGASDEKQAEARRKRYLMSNEQSIRDAAAEWITGLISGNGFGDDYVDDEVK